MSRLQAVLEESLHGLGFPKESRDFHPHLTLGRLRSGGPAVRELTRLLREHADAAAGQATITEAVVYASYLDRTGPTYEVLARAPLAPG